MSGLFPVPTGIMTGCGGYGCSGECPGDAEQRDRERAEAKATSERTYFDAYHVSRSGKCDDCGGYVNQRGNCGNCEFLRESRESYKRMRAMVKRSKGWIGSFG